MCRATRPRETACHIRIDRVGPNPVVAVVANDEVANVGILIASRELQNGLAARPDLNN
jgi:hypothetical protein